MSYYQGRLALVAGASQGIGRAVCAGLVARGCRVLACSRDPGRLEELAREVQVVTRSLDVTDWPAVERAVQELFAAHGVPDLVINCAGKAMPGYLDVQDLSAFQEQMQLNYFGTMHLFRAALPYLVERGRGHLVSTSSLAGLFGIFGYTGYCASKFAVIGFSQALRREVAPKGVRVSVLCPPNTRTPGFDEENKLKPPEVLAAEEKVATVSAEFVAEALLRQLPRGPELIIPTLDGKLAYYLNRLAPWLLDRILRRPG